MNPEQIEHELALMKGKFVCIIIPVSHRASMSIAGELQVTMTKEHMVGFHITSMNVAIIFFAEDVVSLEDSHTEHFTRTIRLKKNSPKA